MKKTNSKYDKYKSQMKNSKLSKWGEGVGIIQTEVQKDKLQ